jgi:hypothetical protein
MIQKYLIFTIAFNNNSYIFKHIIRFVGKEKYFIPFCNEFIKYEINSKLFSVFNAIATITAFNIILYYQVCCI